MPWFLRQLDRADKLGGFCHFHIMFLGVGYFDTKLVFSTRAKFTIILAFYDSSNKANQGMYQMWGAALRPSTNMFRPGDGRGHGEGPH